MTHRDIEEIEIDDDFERDGDCGEYSTFLAFSEGYLLTLDRVFYHERENLALTERFISLPGLATVSGFKRIQQIFEYKVRGLAKSQREMIKAEKAGINIEELECGLEVQLVFLDDSLNPNSGKTLFRFEIDAREFEQLHQNLLIECIRQGHLNFRKSIM